MDQRIVGKNQLFCKGLVVFVAENNKSMMFMDLLVYDVWFGSFKRSAFSCNLVKRLMLLARLSFEVPGEEPQVVGFCFVMCNSFDVTVRDFETNLENNSNCEGYVAVCNLYEILYNC